MKEKTVFERPVSRRRVLTASALLAAAGFASSPLAAAVANAVADFGVYEWTACVINCGQRCPLRAYTKNGTVIRIETDNTVKDGCRVRQLRACLKGRDMRERLYSPDRLKYPMKRVGERGEGRFERISWDEALKTVADKLREIVEKYGNESALLAVLLGPAVARQLPPSLVAPAQSLRRLSEVLRFLFDCSDLGRLSDDLRREPVL